MDDDRMKNGKYFWKNYFNKPYINFITQKIIIKAINNLIKNSWQQSQ